MLAGRHMLRQLAALGILTAASRTRGLIEQSLLRQGVQKHGAVFVRAQARLTTTLQATVIPRDHCSCRTLQLRCQPSPVCRSVCEPATWQYFGLFLSFLFSIFKAHNCPIK